MMHIGVVDLIVVYSLPFLLAGVLLAIVSAVLFVIVRKDIGTLDVSEDIRYNIEIRNLPLTFRALIQVLLFETGVQAAVMYRLSRFFYLHGLRPLAVLLHKVGKLLTNHDVPPTAKVGPGLVLGYSSVILTPFCQVGKNVHFSPYCGIRGWGTVKLEDGVQVGYLSAVVDGAVMGRNSEVAPGSVVVKDVPADHVASGVPAIHIVPKVGTGLQGVVLDLENVLLESAGILTDALHAALRGAGVQPSKRNRPKLERLPPEKVFHQFLRGKAVSREKAMEDYVAGVRAALGSGILRLRASAGDLVEKIRERGLKVAAVSRQPDRLAEEIAERLGLARSLDLVCGADGVWPDWKPQPWIILRPMQGLKIGAERVIYVGSTRMDMQAAFEASIPVYLVASPDVARVPERALVTRFPDLKSVLAEFSKPELPRPVPTTRRRPG